MIHVLITRYELTEYLFSDIEGVDTIFVPYKKHNSLFHRIVKAIYYNVCDKVYSFYYPKFIINRLKKIPVDDCLIVIGEDTYSYWMLSHLCSHVKNKVAYFWNPCTSIINQKLCKKIRKKNDKAKGIIDYIRTLGFKMATFDGSDSERYNMAYFPQFYRKRIDIVSKQSTYKNDFFFCGRDKGRKDIINEMYTLLSQLGNCKFIIPDSNGCEPLSYSDYLNELCLSHVLCEILQSGQVGMTLRSIEALFYEKKLITNNNDIKNYDFYNENNIFILNPNSTLNDVIDFLKRPVLFDASLQKKYSVTSMLTFLSQLH